MDRRILLLAIIPVAAVSVPGDARLTQCRPAANCGAAGAPCAQSINQGDTVSLRPNPAAGASVIRVRVCLASDPVCPRASTSGTQAVSVWGYAGQREIYSETLNATSDLDTGPYTRLPGLTRLAVRCNSSATAYCRVIWQICKEELGLKSAK